MPTRAIGVLIRWLGCPCGARSAGVTIREVKAAVGVAIDGYVDNVNISIVVPEPGVTGLLALGGGLLALARRRR